VNRLDAYLPEHEFAERHGVVVAASPDRVDRAVRSICAGDIPVVRLLTTIRSLGRRPPRRPIVSIGVVLDDSPGEGLVVGLTGQFWKLRGAPVPRPATAAEFLSYDRPDVCKAVIDFRFDGRLLTTETRVHVSDAGARRKFARYWRVIRPFSGLIRIAFLRAVRRQAEGVA